MYRGSGTNNFFQVPVLETPEGAVFESNAIARYGISIIPNIFILIVPLFFFLLMITMPLFFFKLLASIMATLFLGLLVLNK